MASTIVGRKARNFSITVGPANERDGGGLLVRYTTNGFQYHQMILKPEHARLFAEALQEAVSREE